MVKKNERRVQVNERRTRVKERRAQVARHEALMRGIFANETKATVAAATIYKDGEGRELPLPEPAFEVTETVVTPCFAPEALYRYGVGKTLVVDTASFMRPSSTYEDGALGSEPILCLQSNLYQVLSGIQERYHVKNRGWGRGMLFTDRVVYLPDVVFSGDNAICKADVLVVAEPKRSRALENQRGEQECDRTIKDRIETILRVAAANGCETLVCGAFGCGRNGYDTQQVIGLFEKWIDEHAGAIRRIVFSVPRAQFEAFDAAFGKPKEEEPVVVVSKEDDDDIDLASIELPEGITLR